VRLTYRSCHARRVLSVLAAVAALVMLAALPSAPALGAAQPAAVTVPPGPVDDATAPELESLLGEVPLGEGGIALSTLEVPVLAKLLAERPAIATLAGVEGLGGAKGVRRALAKAIAELAEEGGTLEELVGENTLATDFEEQLETAYEESGAGEKPGAPETLEEAVEETLGKTPEEVIAEGLESLTLGELLALQLGRVADPTLLVDQLLLAIDAEELQELLGGRLSGAEPFSQGTLGEVAAAAGLTAPALAEALGRTPVQLPETAASWLAPLSDGQALGVFVATNGLAFAVFGEAPEPEEPEGPGGEGEESGEPEGGGPSVPTPAGPGTSSLPGTTTPPLAVLAPLPPALVGAAPAPALARVRILRRKVRGHDVTLTVQAPAAGVLNVHGNGLKPVRHRIGHAGRVSISTSASSAAIATLAERHRLSVRLHADFKPLAGPSSSATIAVMLS
jgi:hypothetical protein